MYDKNQQKKMGEEEKQEKAFKLIEIATINCVLKKTKTGSHYLSVISKDWGILKDGGIVVDETVNVIIRKIKFKGG